MLSSSLIDLRELPVSRNFQRYRRKLLYHRDIVRNPAARYWVEG